MYVDGVCRSMVGGRCGHTPVFGQGGASALDVLLAVCRLAGGLDGVDVPLLIDNAMTSVSTLTYYFSVL